jgi:sterol desaturase/sphingolipid hydroxylase (fatty acid hydroxylase superfamily)
VQQWLFEAAGAAADVCRGPGQPAGRRLRATGWLLVGLLQIAFMVLVFGALQRWRPVEAVTDKAAVRVDVIYTLIHRLGLFRVALFFTLDPLWDSLVGHLRVAGLPAWSIDQIWPGVTDLAAGQLRDLPGGV